MEARPVLTDFGVCLRWWDSRAACGMGLRSPVLTDFGACLRVDTRPSHRRANRAPHSRSLLSRLMGFSFVCFCFFVFDSGLSFLYIFRRSIGRGGPPLYRLTSEYVYKGGSLRPMLRVPYMTLALARGGAYPRFMIPWQRCMIDSWGHRAR